MCSYIKLSVTQHLLLRGLIRCTRRSSPRKITGEVMGKRIRLIFFELSTKQRWWKNVKAYGSRRHSLRLKCVKHSRLMDRLQYLNEYYGVYVTQPADAKWRLDNMHETYLEDMHSKYVYPNVFMSIDDTNKVSQYDTDIKNMQNRRKADWILNGGIEKEWDSYLKEKWNNMDYQIIFPLSRNTFDQYQESLSEEK